jgi:hypothetical protein
MKKRTIRSGAPRIPQIFGGLVIGMGVLAGTLLVSPSWSAGFKSPEECLAYSGDAHLNCLYAYIEIQQVKISKLEKSLQDQQKTTQELQGKVKQKDLRAQALERKIEDRKDESRAHQFPSRRPYAGFYYRFGSPYYYDPYFGPPFGYSYGLYYPWW